MLLYRHGLMLGDEGLLSLDMAQTAVDSAIAECDRFYPAFQFVLWGDKTPREALDAAMVDAAGRSLNRRSQPGIPLRSPLKMHGWNTWNRVISAKTRAARKPPRSQDDRRFSLVFMGTVASGWRAL